jgi:hypothetical protein
MQKMGDSIDVISNTTLEGLATKACSSLRD